MSEDGFNYDFRPIYFGPKDLEKHFGSSVKGELRRRTAKEMASSGEFDDEVMSHSLNERQRSAVAAIHPHLMGGEYLPDFLEGEIEIARVTLASTLMDVTSIRVQRHEGQYRYRVVDEHESEFAARPETSQEPLTFKELINLIEFCDLVDGPRNMNLEGGASPEEVFNFAKVTSEFYPELHEHYVIAGEEWLDNIQREQEEEEEQWEREYELEQQRRQRILAPFQDRIDKYVLKFGDQMIRNPRWKGYLRLQDVAKRFVEDYLVANGELPTGVHSVTKTTASDSKCDFSDL